ncbi:ADC synthase [Aspergillus caelatus]|uniref:aminodeoxychorismate synthase n=1 Tax=Aspergillus caelatus TaxID=61420 RepID=A0A5N6ZXC9_9EURO|nr:ADC synthase [Aspergillus caelatus]KAE8361569.1 ADC synthase [Aspergillus caelatus]
MAPLLGSWTAPSAGEPSKAHLHTSPRKNILYVDAYDSFSYNVVAMLEEVLGVKVTVIMIDSEWPEGNMAEFLQYFEAVVLGPGPGDPNVPQDIGIMRDIWALSHADLLPVFGICLGFQSLCLHHSIAIERLPYPLHGRVYRISTAEKDIFKNLQDVEVTLYHSLYAKLDDSLEAALTEYSDEQIKANADLDLLAWLPIEQDNGSEKTIIPMAVRHNEKPFWGVQFHPESCKSDRGVCSELLRKWWEMSLDYNKEHGRGSYGTLPKDIIRRLSDVISLPEIAFTLLNWCASTSRSSAFRSLTTSRLNAEFICERLNAPGSPTVLFQSNGKYSIISVPGPTSWRLEYYAQTEALLVERLQGHSNGHTDSGIKKSLSVHDLWETLRYLMDMKKVESGDDAVPFWGGFLGYFSYEMGLACLARPKTHSNDHYGYFPPQSRVATTDPADVSLLWTERSVIVDNETGRITIQSTRNADDISTGWLDETLQYLTELSHVGVLENQNANPDTGSLDTVLRQCVIRFPNEQTYKKQVEACKAELEAGESYELCLTCETSITLPSPGTDSERVAFPWKLYKRLREYNPAAFSAYARLGSVKVVSSSPECFLNWDRSFTLEMKPMKGTVRKSASMTMKKAKEILGSTKEMAENLMIADLIRHDLYGICGSGGVRVEKLLEVEDHGRVYQMITHVKGDVDPSRPGLAVRNLPHLHSSNMSAYGLTALQRCLPPGSMTGAPKERSCMHLSLIEARKRGIYSGVMGFLDLGGGGSFSVLIRTAFSCSDDKDNEQTWRIGAGGAVTILSTADGEWNEMLTKLTTVCGVFAPSDLQGSGKV